MAAKLVSLFACISIGGQRVPVLSPDQPYKYLGWLITMTLCWSHQFKKTLEMIRAHGASVRSSLATMRQVVALIDGKIRPAVTYDFALAPYTIAQIQQLDRSLANTARQACRLPRGFAQAGIMLAQDKGGMGLHSLMLTMFRQRPQLTHMAYVRRPRPAGIGHAQPYETSLGKMGLVTR